MPQNSATGSNTTNRTGDTTEKTTNKSKTTLDPFSAHALTLLENEEFSDCRIILKSSKENFYPITFRAHKALLARSPRLKTILTSPSYNNDDNEIEAITGETFCMVKAFETALQNLYGLPILDAGSLRHAAVTALGYSDEEILLQKVYPFPLHAALADFAMCYAASGAFFEMKEIVEAGVRLASEVLHWENVEMVLYFALCVSAFIISPSTDSVGDNGEATTVTDLRDIYAPRLTTAALTFLVNYIEAQAQSHPFTLYISAQCKCMPDRIPEHLRQIPGSILSNPKLAEVKFGSFNSLEEEEEHEAKAKSQPSPETATLSAILICLPYQQLREAFAIMREKGVLSGGLAQAIVVEREARRLYALRVLVEEARQQQQQRSQNQEVNQERIRELGFREFSTTKSVHDGVVRVQIELQREWVGM